MRKTSKQLFHFFEQGAALTLPIITRIVSGYVFIFSCLISEVVRVIKFPVQKHHVAETLQSLQSDLLAAIALVLLLLAANYQSFGLSITVLSKVPAIILGAMLMLLATGSILNLQSYMGIIKSSGVSPDQCDSDSDEC